MSAENILDKAQLGYATNAELIAELAARYEFGEWDPGYSTMGGVSGVARAGPCRCGMSEVTEDAEVTVDVMKHTRQACFTVDRHGHPT